LKSIISFGIAWWVEHPKKDETSLYPQTGSGSTIRRIFLFKGIALLHRRNIFAGRLRPVWVAVLIWGVLLSHLDCHADLVDRILAIVNEDVILLSDLEQAMAPLREKLKQAGYSETQQRVYLSDQQPLMLQKMIDDKLTDQQAKRLNVTVGEEETDKAIERFKAINKMSAEDMSRMLKLEGFTNETFRDQIKEQLIQTRIVNREVKSKIVITDVEIKAYYDAHQNQYTGVTKYHLRHILMKTASQSSDERENVRLQMQRIHERLKGGETFVSLAKVYSQAATAQDGGDLGFFETRLLATPIRNALAGLASGQFTPVIDTEQGFQIFFVEELVQTGGKSLQEATSEIQDKLFAEVVEEKFKTWHKELRQRAHIQILE
jgi:peptidyl-prolyl cis-trans isomerase SurA